MFSAHSAIKIAIKSHDSAPALAILTQLCIIQEPIRYAVLAAIVLDLHLSTFKMPCNTSTVTACHRTLNCKVLGRPFETQLDRPKLLLIGMNMCLEDALIWSDYNVH